MRRTQRKVESLREGETESLSNFKVKLLHTKYYLLHTTYSLLPDDSIPGNTHHYTRPVAEEFAGIEGDGAVQADASFGIQQVAGFKKS